MNRHVIWKVLVILASIAVTFGGLLAKTIEIEDGAWTAVGPAQYDCPANDMARGPDGLIYFAARGTTCGEVRISDIAVYDPTTGAFESLSPLTSAPNGPIRQIAISGSGTLYAAGAFTEIGGVAANRIAKYSNGQWSALGGGLDRSPTALQIIGNTVFVGTRGLFSAGGQSVSGLAQWDGNNWDDVGGGVDGPGQVYSFADRNGSLVVGGWFSSAGAVNANNLAIWNGSAWSSLDEINVSIPRVYSVGVTSEGIVAAGSDEFDISGQKAAVAQWNGRWKPLTGAGENPSDPGVVSNVPCDIGFFRITDINSFNGNVVIGGCFALDQTPVRVASWDGVSWTPLVVGCVSYDCRGGTPAISLGKVDGQLSASVAVLSPRLQADGWLSANLRLTQQGWQPLFAGETLAKGHDTRAREGGISLLIASDEFVYSRADRVAGRKRTGFARWDIQNERWEMLGRVPPPLDLGSFPNIRAAALDPEGNLYFIGRLNKYLDGISDPNAAESIAKWDGHQFEILASDVQGQRFKLQYANGLLHLAGNLSTIDGSAVGNIATWDGTSWRSFVSPPVHNWRGVWQFVAHDDQLFIGSEFENQNGEFEWRVAKWDGSEWRFVGEDQITFGGMSAMSVINDRLFIATSKQVSSTKSVGEIAMWDGVSWTFLGADLDASFGNSWASAIVELAGNIYITGRFSSVAGGPANVIARWDGQDWHPIGSGESLGVSSFGIRSSIPAAGSLYISGEFDSVEGHSSEKFAIFTPRKELAVQPECGVVEDVPTGQSTDSEIFTVLNSGISDIEIQAIHLEGADSADFSVAPASDSCSGSTLKADQTCEFQIRFTPSSNGVKRANILVNSDATQGPNSIEVVSSSGVVHFDGFEQSACN